jgi:hypothetical protein
VLEDSANSNSLVMSRTRHNAVYELIAKQLQRGVTSIRLPKSHAATAMEVLDLALNLSRDGYGIDPNVPADLRHYNSVA